SSSVVVLSNPFLVRDSILGLLAPEPGCQLASFTGNGMLAPNLNNWIDVDLEVYVRAPAAAGPFVLKASCAGDNGTGFHVTDPPGAVSFASLTTAPYVCQLTVVADPVGPFALATQGLIGTNYGGFAGVALGDIDGDGNDDLAA